MLGKLYPRHSTSASCNHEDRTPRPFICYSGAMVLPWECQANSISHASKPSALCYKRSVRGKYSRGLGLLFPTQSPLTGWKSFSRCDRLRILDSHLPLPSLLRFHATRGKLGKLEASYHPRAYSCPFIQWECMPSPSSSNVMVQGSAPVGKAG